MRRDVVSSYLQPVLIHTLQYVLVSKKLFLLPYISYSVYNEKVIIEITVLTVTVTVTVTVTPCSKPQSLYSYAVQTNESCVHARLSGQHHSQSIVLLSADIHKGCSSATIVCLVCFPRSWWGIPSLCSVVDTELDCS